jgi:nickel-dependent lactate racemase
VQTHRRGVEAAREVFVRPVPARADVVLADARPTVKDYWQGVKALAHATRGVRRGGTAILAGEFPERVAPTHPDFARHALKSYDEVAEAVERGKLDDRIASASLRLHALIREHCRVICVSPGMRAIEKEELGFEAAESVEEALETALDRAPNGAKVGVMEFAGDVLPKPPV